MSSSWKHTGPAFALLIAGAAASAGCSNHPADVAGPSTSASSTSPSGTFGTPRAPVSAPPSAAGGPTTLPDQLALDDALAKVMPLLQDTYGDWYTNSELRQPDGPGPSSHSALVIHRIPHPALDDAVRRALPGVPVVFVDAKYSFKQMTALVRSIDSDMKDWTSRGVQITMFGPGLDGRVQIGVLDPDKARALLEARYGADRITVVKGSMGVAD